MTRSTGAVMAKTAMKSMGVLCPNITKLTVQFLPQRSPAGREREDDGMIAMTCTSGQETNQCMKELSISGVDACVVY